MSEILLVGTLEQIRDRLLLAQTILQTRATEGYPLLQSDEEWVYDTAKDDNVCPVCAPHDRRVFRGDEIASTFPSSEITFAGAEGAEIRPRVHIDNPWLNGVCRCTLTLLDVDEIITERLYQELEEIAI